MIDSRDERVLPIADLAEFVPTFHGKRICLSTLYRWVKRGISIGDGERVQLEATFIGGRLCSSVEALERFQEAVTAAKQGESVPVFESKPSKACLAAEKKLIALGM